ncbi:MULTISPECIES: hypothetical protein [Streptomyces]|jgi:hypothetical protein|uniref:Uncharacterized protein n=3 Tax=Streptomyces TaxID=1883 RepID=M3D8B3_9ACTN|nr:MULTISPECIES: hypothetical protein [Streptomyces]EMF52487.1 hypothetical protein SBD_5563 [Streptomyces bottropensis ATCC 25435]KND44239.1 membrane protein [Streptomyces stelliscabiei]MBE1598430.1 hypothetical protein [Streptomyces stelliscabiei]MDX2518751.1 hypothetical protein [Streptomyces stelliscabiei]MDX2556360.1 hypothetical protein [Streptomyces stelliscabiei]
MADNQNPQGNYDPAGSTQMFRAFVDETPSGGRQAASGAAGGSGPRVGVIVGVLAAVAVVAAVVWLALA